MPIPFPVRTSDALDKTPHNFKFVARAHWKGSGSELICVSACVLNINNFCKHGLLTKSLLHTLCCAIYFLSLIFAALKCTFMERVQFTAYLDPKLNGLVLYQKAGDIFQIPFNRLLLTHNGKVVEPRKSRVKQGFMKNPNVFAVVKGYGGGKTHLPHQVCFVSVHMTLTTCRFLRIYVQCLTGITPAFASRTAMEQ